MSTEKNNDHGANDQYFLFIRYAHIQTFLIFRKCSANDRLFISNFHMRSKNSTPKFCGLKCDWKYDWTIKNDAHGKNNLIILTYFDHY